MIHYEINEYNKNIFYLYGIVATSFIATLGSIAFAVDKQKGRYTLTNSGIVNIEGPCKFFQVGDIINVQGTAVENGVTYIVTIDNSKNEGLLIGAGTFDLAIKHLLQQHFTKCDTRQFEFLRIQDPSLHLFSCHL